MNKKASKHPQVTILEIQCPLCGELYYITENGDDDLEESNDTYECTACDFESTLAEWPAQEFTKGRVILSSGIPTLEEEDW